MARSGHDDCTSPETARHGGANVKAFAAEVFPLLHVVIIENGAGPEPGANHFPPCLHGVGPERGNERPASGLVPGLLEELQPIAPSGWVLKRCRSIQEAVAAFPEKLKQPRMATPKSKWEHEAGTDKGRNRSPVGHGTLTRRAAVVDLEAVEKEGLRLLRCLRTAMRDLAILALSSEADGRGPVEALMAGACGHFCKPVPPKQLARALVRVALGEIVLCQRSQEMVVRALWGMGMTRAGTELTPRQNEIMSGLLRRRIDKEIADEMGIKKATVHCQRALKTGQEGADENRPL